MLEHDPKVAALLRICFLSEHDGIAEGCSTQLAFGDVDLAVDMRASELAILDNIIECIQPGVQT